MRFTPNQIRLRLANGLSDVPCKRLNYAYHLPCSPFHFTSLALRVALTQPEVTPNHQRASRRPFNSPSSRAAFCQCSKSPLVRPPLCFFPTSNYMHTPNGLLCNQTLSVRFWNIKDIQMKISTSFLPARLKAAFLPYLGSCGAITQNLMRLGLRDVSESPVLVVWFK